MKFFCCVAWIGLGITPETIVFFLITYYSVLSFCFKTELTFGPLTQNLVCVYTPRRPHHCVSLCLILGLSSWTRTTLMSNMHVKNSISWFKFKSISGFECNPNKDVSNACKIFSCFDLNLVCDIMFICDNVRLVFFSLECGSFIINSQYLRCHMLKYHEILPIDVIWN